MAKVDDVIELISRHDECGVDGCAAAVWLASNDVELNAIVGECPTIQSMRPLRDAFLEARAVTEANHS